MNPSENRQWYDALVSVIRFARASRFRLRATTGQDVWAADADEFLVLYSTAHSGP